jgi:hypothetical protein
MTDAGACRYRAPDGTRCAVGCLITDEAYTPALEGHPVGLDIVRQALEASGVGLGPLALLAHLQDLHDSTPPVDWVEELKLLAKRHGLSPAAIVAMEGAGA